MKAAKQYFAVMLFIMLYKVILTFESVDEIFTVRRALPLSLNKPFLQVSQSGYANLINGHASLQSQQASDATTNC